MKEVQERQETFPLDASEGSMASFSFGDDKEEEVHFVGQGGNEGGLERSLIRSAANLHSCSSHASISMRPLNASNQQLCTSESHLEKDKFKLHGPASALERRVPLHSLGQRFESRQFHGTMNFPTKHHLRNLCLILFSSLVLVNGAVALFNHFVLPKDANVHQNYDMFENPLEDILKETIPFLQEWYRADVKEADKLILTPTYRPKAAGYQGNYTAQGHNRDCLGHFFQEMSMAVEHTDPELIEIVLQRMGISQSPGVRAILQTELNRPQPVADLLEESLGCLRSNPVMVDIACSIQDAVSPWWNMSDPVQRTFLRDTIHGALVHNKLTAGLLEDWTALHDVAVVMTGAQRLAMEDYIDRTFTGVEREFKRAKYLGVALGLDALAKTIAESEIMFPYKSLVQLNILEAVKLDVEHGYQANARVGMALAAAVQFEPTVEDHTVSWPLGKDWADAYLSWNLAFVLGSFRPFYVAKLALPMVSCAVLSPQAKDFMTMRVISLSLSMLGGAEMGPLEQSRPGDAWDTSHLYDENHSEKALTQKFLLAQPLGTINQNGLHLLNPSRDSIEEMMYELCGERCHDGSWRGTDSEPTSYLDNEDFAVYTGFVIWITSMLAGFGLELLLWISVFQKGWSEALEKKWMIAQFVFPLCAATTLGLSLQQNFMALPFLVLGLWKFGFPETFLYLRGAFPFAEDESLETCWMQRLADFLNGVGTAVHHGAASFLISMLLAGVLPPSRHIVSPCLVLMMQHWFVLLRDSYEHAYIAIELVLEVFFEWTVLSNLQYHNALHWTAIHACICMLVAHWLYLGGGFAELVVRSMMANSDIPDPTHTTGSQTSVQSPSSLNRPLEFLSLKAELETMDPDAKLERVAKASSFAAANKSNQAAGDISV